MGQEQSNIQQRRTLRRNTGGEILESLRQNGELDGAKQFGVARNSRIKKYMTSYDNFEKHMLRANALAAMVDEDLGVRLAFSVRPLVKSNDVLRMVWKIGNPLAVRVEQSFANDQPSHSVMCSARGFYYLYLALEDLWTSIQVSRAQQTRSGIAMESALEDDEDESECPICQDQQIDVVLPCSHSMCRICYLRWMEEQTNCPLCRQEQDGGEDELWELTSFDGLTDDDASAHFNAVRSRIHSFLATLPNELVTVDPSMRNTSSSTMTQSTTTFPDSLPPPSSSSRSASRSCDQDPVVVNCPSRDCAATYAVPAHLRGGFFRCPSCALLAKLPPSYQRPSQQRDQHQSPPDSYSYEGVNVSYLPSAPPHLLHLPRVSNGETFYSV